MIPQSTLKMDFLSASLEHGKLTNEITLQNRVVVKFSDQVLTGKYVISQNPWVCPKDSASKVEIIDYIDPHSENSEIELTGFVVPKNGGHSHQPFNSQASDFGAHLRCLGLHASLPNDLTLSGYEDPNTIRVTYFNYSRSSSQQWPVVEYDKEATLTVYPYDKRPSITEMQPPAIGPLAGKKFELIEIANKFHLLAKSSLPVAETDVSVEYVASQVLECCPFIDDVFSNRSSGRQTTRGIKTKDGSFAEYPSHRQQVMMDWVLKILSLPESERHVAQILMAGFIQNYALNLHGAACADKYSSSEGGGQFATTMLGTMMTCLFYEDVPGVVSHAKEAMERKGSFGIGDYAFVYTDKNGKVHYGGEPAYYEIDPWVECLLGINNGAWTGNYQWNGQGTPKFHYCLMQSTSNDLKEVDFGMHTGYNSTYNGVVTGPVYLFLQYTYFFKIFGMPPMVKYIADIWFNGMVFVKPEIRNKFKARIEQIINHHNAKGGDQIPLSKSDLILDYLQNLNGKVEFAYYNTNVYNWIVTHFGPHKQ